MIYQWRPEYRRAKRADAQAIGEELEALGENLTPDSLVQRAKRRSTVLHKLFTWDDTEAAHEHRLSEAREILRFLTVEIRHEVGGEVALARAYFVIAGAPDEGKLFIPYRRVIESPEMRGEVIARALSELESWTARYESIRDTLTPIFNEVEKAKRKHKKRKRKVA